MSRKILVSERLAKIKALLPPERGYWERPSRPHIRILEGMFWILRTGLRGEIYLIIMGLGVLAIPI